MTALPPSHGALQTKNPACAGFTGIWSGKRGSNPRPQPWQGCALPTELFPRARPNLTAQWGCFLPTGCPPDRPRARSGGEGDRTPDLVNAIHALSQLSYAPAILGPAKRGPAGTR